MRKTDARASPASDARDLATKLAAPNKRNGGAVLSRFITTLGLRSKDAERKALQSVTRNSTGCVAQSTPIIRRVSKLRQHLQRAARAFADELFEAFQAEFRSAPRQLPADRSHAHHHRPAPALKPRRRRPGSTSTNLERVLVYVTEHPGVSPKEIIEATGIHRPSVFAALRDACAMGALVKHGESRHVTYAPPGHAASLAEPPASPRRKYQRTAARAADICEEVVAWVAAHPGCAWSEIAPTFRGAEGPLRAALGLARANGRVRMEGTRRTARYYATDLPG